MIQLNKNGSGPKNQTDLLFKQESFEYYKDAITIAEDVGTSFVEVSAKHHSPYLAQELVNLIIKKINETMRDEERDTSQKSLNFLNSQLNKTSYEDLRQSIISLQESQMQNLMIIEANEDYVFKIIDPAISPELKFEPKRSVLVIIWTFIGLVVSSVIALVSNNRKKAQS